MFNPVSVDVGDKVGFEFDHGPQTGIVTEILRNIANAQPFARVETVDFSCDVPVAVPINDLHVLGRA